MRKIWYFSSQMLRRFLDFQLSFFDKGKPLHKVRPFVSAVDTFCYEPLANAKRGPFIRDAVDLKRWMFLVVTALLPAILMAIWNTGVQSFVYGSNDATLYEGYLQASKTFSGYFSFTFAQGRWVTILGLGAFAFFPLMLISYIVGGTCEAIFASIRGHEIAEGFLVTGMLYPLILPPNLPYWQAALGIVFGVVIGKELFGGTGMNILNPALTARAFLFFTFPGNMSGDIWVGTNSYEISQSINQMNQQAKRTEVDGFSQASALQTFNQAISDIKRIHTATVATNQYREKTPLYPVIKERFDYWKAQTKSEAELGNLSIEDMRAFMTAPKKEGGLALLPANFIAAYQYSGTEYGFGKYTNGNLFWGNIPGSMGETSTFASLLGALFLILVGVGSWRTMAAFALGAIITAYAFQFFATHTGIDSGAWNAAKYSMPFWRHLMMGGLAFGLVYMATDPVSAPAMAKAKWIYGILIGVVTILIRVINPAYPEGVMLAILFANVFAPLIDYYVIRNYRRVRCRA